MSGLRLSLVSVLAIVLVILGVLVIGLALGGALIARRRTEGPGWEQHIRAADQAIEQARAADRGWSRELIDEAARRGLGEHRPGFEPDSIELVLVDDRPGVVEDRAHLIALAASETVRIVLARDASGAWGVEQVAEVERAG
jgi:hypothetical protein